MAGMQVTEWNHRLLTGLIPKGGLCIDATAGTGRDSLFLAQQVGSKGRVVSFDIQQDAIDQTKKRLEAAGCVEWVQLVLDSHVCMDRYVTEPVDAIVFNFGYLPGGDHTIATAPESSLAAVEQGLVLLRTGGVMSLCVYSGKETGMEEYETLTQWAAGLSPKSYLVIRNDFYNRPNHPPVILLIWKL